MNPQPAPRPSIACSAVVRPHADRRRALRAGTIILAAGLLLAGCTSGPAAPPLWVAEEGLVFCYATIADPDCSKMAVPGAGPRLIAVAPRLTFVPLDPSAPPSRAGGPVALPGARQPVPGGAT